MNEKTHKGITSWQSWVIIRTKPDYEVMTKDNKKLTLPGESVFLQHGFYDSWEEAVKDIVIVIECDHADENGIITKEAMGISREAERQFREHTEKGYTYKDSDGTEYNLALFDCAREKEPHWKM